METLPKTEELNGIAVAHPVLYGKAWVIAVAKTSKITRLLSLCANSFSSLYLILLRNCPYAFRSDGTDIQQQPIILIVVGDDDAALLLHGQYVLHIVLDVGPCLNKSCVNVTAGEIYDVETVLQVTDYANYLFVLPLFLEHGDKLRQAERRNVEPFAREGIEIVQTVGILLESGIATVAAHEHVGVHKYVVGIEWACLACHYSEYKVWELFLLFFGQRVRPTGGPKTYEFFNELSACQSVFLQKQFYHTLALLLNLFVSFAHFAVVLMNTAAKIIIFLQNELLCPYLFIHY